MNVYLDNASTSFPKPKAVCDSMYNFIANIGGNSGRSNHTNALESNRYVFDTRENIASFFNFPKIENVVFTNNITSSLNILINGILKKGDHVITSSIEHNSVIRPLWNLKEANIIDLDIAEANSLGILSVESINKLIKPNTKLIVLTHASNVIGSIQPIKEIGELCKKNNIFFILDSAQSAGVLPVDFAEFNLSALAFTGHKSLLGPQGIGGFIISDELNEICEPFILGGTGSLSHALSQPDFLPDKFESGTLNIPGIVGLNEGIKFIFSKRIDNIRNHEISLMEYLTSELQKLPFVKLYGETNPQLKTPVLSFNIDNHDSSEVGRYLNSLNIYLRTSYHCAPLIHKIIGTERIGTVRVSPGYFNTFNDIETFILAIKNFYTHI